MSEQCVHLNVLRLNILCVCSFEHLFGHNLQLGCMGHSGSFGHMEHSRTQWKDLLNINQQDCDCFLSLSDQWILCSVMCFGTIQSWT